MEQTKTYKQRFRRRSCGTAICETCGKEFNKAFPEHKFCCHKCWYKGYHKSKSKRGVTKCGVCGKEFTQTSEKHAFCSRACRDIAHKEKYKPQSKDPYCKFCGGLKPENNMRKNSCGQPECEKKRRAELDARNERQRNHVDTFGKYEKKEIAELRKALGLREIIDGNVECLSCKSVFYSEDVKNRRICRICRESEERADISPIVDMFRCRVGV